MADALARSRSIRLPLIITLFLASFFVVKPIWHHFGMTGDARYPVFIIPIIATILFMREMRMQSLLHGGPNPAVAVYLRRISACVMAYFALLLLANYLEDHGQAHGLAAILLALLPAVPILGMVLTFGAYLRDEHDEYVRMLAVQSSLYATGITLTVTTVWGFLEQSQLVSHYPASLAFGIWFAALGLSQLCQKLFNR
jgi:hypothetical protein